MFAFTPKYPNLSFIMDISINSNVSLNSKEQTSFNISNEGINLIETDRESLLNKLMQLYLKHNLSKAAVEDIAVVMNSVPGAKIKIPTTKYLLFKEFLANNSHNVNKLILCNRCKQYSAFLFGSVCGLKCDSCKGDLSKNNFFFVHISAESQLKRIVENYYDEIKHFRGRFSNNQCDDICDAYDGQVIRKMETLNFIYSLSLNTDGLVMHNSGKGSLYPVLMVCNFLPPELRFKEKNMIVVGLYYGIEKPDFFQYLDPIIVEFERLSEFGFFLRGDHFQFHITHACFDLPMKSAIQNIRQYNGYSACYYCDHPGEKTQNGVRYTNQIVDSVLRDHKTMILTAGRAIKTGAIVNGVKGFSCLTGFKNIDIVRSIAVDYMHGALLGVTKNLLSFWLDPINHQKSFYIKPKEKLIINKRLVAIKLCRFINRNVISIDNYNKFKSSQYRTFLLYLFPVLQGILGRKYFDHFQLLSFSIYILLKERITPEELIHAETMLKKFVSDYEILYGKCSMTMNVHCLLHLVECVKNLGPLWCFSLFCFESYNGTLAKYGKYPNNVLNQVVESVVLNFAAEKVTVTQTKDKIFSEIFIRPSASDKSILESEKLCGTTKIFSAMKRGNTIFTSINYKCAKKTADYFIETNQNDHGKIKYFVDNGSELFAVISEYEIVSTMNQIFIAKETGQTILRPTKDIREKLIYMQIKDTEYVVKRPNKYEMN